jgi:hypothetical protein
VPDDVTCTTTVQYGCETPVTTTEHPTFWYTIGGPYVTTHGGITTDSPGIKLLRPSGNAIWNATDATDTTYVGYTAQERITVANGVATVSEYGTRGILITDCSIPKTAPYVSVSCSGTTGL